MSTLGAVNHARRARSQRTSEGKLDEIAHAIEELARAVAEVENHIKRAESFAAAAANRR
jgi:outer membrane murein-binding lipoprotein Lpp